MRTGQDKSQWFPVQSELEALKRVFQTLIIGQESWNKSKVMLPIQLLKFSQPFCSFLQLKSGQNAA